MLTLQLRVRHVKTAGWVDWASVCEAWLSSAYPNLTTSINWLPLFLTSSYWSPLLLSTNYSSPLFQTTNHRSLSLSNTWLLNFWIIIILNLQSLIIIIILNTQSLFQTTNHWLLLVPINNSLITIISIIDHYHTKQPITIVPDNQLLITIIQNIQSLLFQTTSHWLQGTFK